MDLSKWDNRFYSLALEVANWSKDPNKKVGCVVISPDKRKVSYGYNGFPANISDDSRLNNRKIKNELSLHAEVNAILNAKENLASWNLYCSEAICSHCALVIIQAGITKVTMPAAPASSNWFKSCEKAIALFKEANVTINLVHGIPYYV